MTSLPTPPAPAPLRAPLWAPRHWPAWLGLGLMWLIARLPYPLQRGLGHLLGALLWRTQARRRRIAGINLELCFPELAEEERRHLVREVFAALGMSLVEIAMAWWTPVHRLERLAEIRGLEHIEGALRQGRGVIAMCAHYSAWEIGARLLSMRIPMAAVYRPHEHPVMEWALRRFRPDICREALIARDDVRTMVRHLKRGGVLWYAQDQNYGHKGSVFADFFGIPAATNTATSRLARMSGAAVIPFTIRRRPGNAGYLLEIAPPLADFPGDDPAADTHRINRIIEEWVRQAPEQYNWIHRRFKDRPAGEARFY